MSNEPTVRTDPQAAPPALPAAPTDGRRLAAAFWLAAAATLTLHLVPYGSFLLYPFGLLTTWAHEIGHGLAAIAVGGRFAELHLFPDLGGVAYSYRPDTRLASAAIAAGGLLGPAMAGGAVVYLSARPRPARWVSSVLAAALLLSVVLWVRNPFGIAAILALAAGFAAVARYGSPRLEQVVGQITGINLALGSLSTFDYMFTREFVRGGERQISDTQAIAEALLLPYWFWGGLVALLSLAILFGAFWLAWIRPARRAAAAARAAA